MLVYLMKVMIPAKGYSRMRELNLISMFLFHQVVVSFTNMKVKSYIIFWKHRNQRGLNKIAKIGFDHRCLKKKMNVIFFK